MITGHFQVFAVFFEKLQIILLLYNRKLFFHNMVDNLTFDPCTPRFIQKHQSIGTGVFPSNLSILNKSCDDRFLSSNTLTFRSFIRFVLPRFDEPPPLMPNIPNSIQILMFVYISL